MMTRTEERLRDALRTTAAQLRDEDLRPLTTSAGERQAPSRQRRNAVLAPLAAALCVAMVIGLALAVAGFLGHPGKSVPATPGGLPRYYATLYRGPTTLAEIAVRETATGRQVAVIAEPPMPPGTGGTADPNSTALRLNTRVMAAIDVATADDRTFYVLYSTQTTLGTGDFVIESFTVSSSGQVSPLSPVKGGVLPDLGWRDAIGGFAIAPGNQELAVVIPATHRTGRGTPSKIVVIDARTGTQTVWRGGLDRSNTELSVESPSWTADGKSLVFVAQWCPANDVMSLRPNIIVCPITGNANHTAEVRELKTSGPGGLLSEARVLLTESSRYQYFSHALISPDGASMTVALLSDLARQRNGSYVWQRLTVARISVATRTQIAVLYQGTAIDRVPETITADGSGRFVVLGHGGFMAAPFGWLDGGTLRPLRVEQYNDLFAW